jgi:alkylation response protein AidB-like acyl-CoA dehydrogenase
VEALLPVISDRAGEIEQERRVPPDLVEELAESGSFRMSVPHRYGGAELDLMAQMRVLERLGTADGSTGWTVMVGGLAPLLAIKLAQPVFEDLYAGGPDVVMACVFNPTGVATPVDGGFRVSGRWSFASGCEHARWFVGHCVVDDGRDPPVRMMMMPMSDVKTEDTWSVLGLCGTGSHDVLAADVFVPSQHSLVLWDEPWMDAPLFRIPELSFSTLEFSALATGIAGGALHEIMTTAKDKVPAFGPDRLGANPLFQNQLGEADARLRAVRAALYDEAERAWKTATIEQPFSPEQRAQIRGTTTWALETATSIVDMAYTAGGGSAIYTLNPLLRRLRDIHTMTQHFALKHDTFTTVGAVLMGEEIDLTFL